MSYDVQHKIYLKDGNEEKLTLLQELLIEYNGKMDIGMDTVFDDDGEPIPMLCLSDAEWNFGRGCTWYTFDVNMCAISEAFNRKYPDETIYAYTKTEDGFEEKYSFEDGNVQTEKVIHFRQELEKVCKQLNENSHKAYAGLYEIQMVAGHPTVRFREGAYTMIDWNYFELYGNIFQESYSTELPTAMHISSRNYSSLEDRARAMKLLYDYMVEHRGEFR